MFCNSSLANKPLAMRLLATCVALAKNLRRVFFISEPLAKGFWPLATGFAWIANQLDNALPLFLRRRGVFPNGYN